jgi:hypothetical protein
MMKEQLQCGLLGKHRDLDGVEPAQLPVTRSEENARGEIEQDSLGSDRATELSGVLKVVKDEQGVSSSVEFLKREL